MSYATEYKQHAMVFTRWSNAIPTSAPEPKVEADVDALLNRRPPTRPMSEHYCLSRARRQTGAKRDDEEERRKGNEKRRRADLPRQQHEREMMQRKEALLLAGFDAEGPVRYRRAACWEA